MQFRDIDQQTQEGKLLLAAVSVLTTSKKLRILGRKVNGRLLTPDEIVEELCKISKIVYQSGKETNSPNTFTEAARPLIKHIAENHDPHIRAIVDSVSAELLEGFESTRIMDYVKD